MARLDRQEAVARPFGSRQPHYVPDTSHLTDWGRGNDQQPMHTQAFTDRHRVPHGSSHDYYVSRMAGADMSASLHDPSPQPAASSAATPRSHSTPWATEDEEAAPAQAFKPTLHQRHSGTDRAWILNEDSRASAESFVPHHLNRRSTPPAETPAPVAPSIEEESLTPPHLKRRPTPPVTTRSLAGVDDAEGQPRAASMAPATGGGGAPAGANLDELAEVLSRLSVALSERAVHGAGGGAGVDAAQSLEVHLRRYDPSGTGVIAPSDLMRLMKSASCTNCPPALLTQLPPRMLAPGGIRCDTLLQLLPAPPDGVERLCSVKNDAPLNFRGQQTPRGGAAAAAAPPPPHHTSPAPAARPAAAAAAVPSAQEGTRLRRQVLEAAGRLESFAADEAWATLNPAGAAVVGEGALVAGLHQLGLTLGDDDARLFHALLCEPGAPGVGWPAWSAFFEPLADSAAARRRRLVLSRQLGAVRKLRGTPHAPRLAQWLAAQQDADGFVDLGSFREGLERHGVLLSPTDFFTMAVAIDPAGAGARVRCDLVIRELQEQASMSTSWH